MLGAVAAQRLGVDRLTVAGRPVQVYLGGTWFTVAGMHRAVAARPEIERAALIGYPIAHTLFGTTRHASMLYVRADPERVREASSLLGATADPQNPEQTQVSRPSDALQARADAQSTLTSVFLGLGAVALLVGGVGIANVMVISVLERRPEIGLRRALGARAGHIAVQFLGESVLLSLLGGAAGSSSAPPRPPATRPARAGSSSCPCSRSRAGSRSLWRSACSPACTRRCAPPAWHPRRHCAACKSTNTRRAGSVMLAVEFGLLDPITSRGGRDAGT